MFRLEFQKLIFDCYENRIDIVLVKTISRFARNTVDLLETVSVKSMIRISSLKRRVYYELSKI